MVKYTDSLEAVTSDDLNGFFAGWRNRPSPETHLKILQNSDKVILAVEQDSGKVVGFITAVTDGVLSAYIPLLEVLSEYRSQGIGQHLIRRMLDKLKGLYMIDLTCDPDVQSFYLRFGMKRSTGMMVRNYERQSGAE